MSGICGAWVLDDGASIDLAPIIERLERRGPDGTHQWLNGPLAIGHTLLATTPEALVEVLPLVDADSGCAITADARLDNREELITALRLSSETRTIGDGELILRAYLEWDKDCPTHLLGDFVFAIWDARKARLFCARDHMGMRQLIYHHDPGRLFIFATEVEAVIAHDGVHKRISQGRVADFLDDLEGLDLSSTFFEDVYRLPAAHYLTVDRNGMSVCRYWELKPGPELTLPSNQAYAAAFLDVFTEAVRCRLRSPGPIGSMLSGGLDSNAVAAVSAGLLRTTTPARLKTFSAIASGFTDCAETRAIRTSIRHADFDATVIDHAELPHLVPVLAGLARQNAEPFDGQMTMIQSVYYRAHRAGLKVVLDGVGADLVLTAGNRVAQDLRRGAIRKAWHSAKGRSRFWGKIEPAWHIYLSGAWAAFVPAPIRSLRRRLLARRDDRRLRQSEQLVGNEFAIATGLFARRAAYRKLLGTGTSYKAADRARLITHPSFVAGRERYDRVASALAIEPRDPFFDLRVINFCLSLPSDQLESGGWPKIVLRRAMDGLVARSVAWRVGKDHLGLPFTNALLDQWMEWRDIHRKQWNRISRFVSPRISVRSSDDMDIWSRYKLAMLALWFERYHSGLDIVARKS